jgi:hypothetical protein
MRQLVDMLGKPNRDESWQTIEEGQARLRFAIDLAIRAGNLAMRFYKASQEKNEPRDGEKNADTTADHAAQSEVEVKLNTQSIAMMRWLRNRDRLKTSPSLQKAIHGWLTHWTEPPISIVEYHFSVQP